MGTNRKQMETAIRDGRVADLFVGLGWTPMQIPVPAAAWPAWGWSGPPAVGEVAAATPGAQILAVRGTYQRDLVVSVFSRAPLATIFWVFIEERELVFAFATFNQDQRPFVRTLTLHREHPDPMGLERVQRLAVAEVARPAELDCAGAMAAHLAEVLDQEGLTRAFFDGFRAALARLERELLNGPEDERLRRDASLVVLLRLVFLYFLQREGLLDDDPRYLIRRLRQSVVGQREFYDLVLRPLFFGVLNTPPKRRTQTAATLGEVPFLNGGLFEPTAVERRHPDMCWTNSVLVEIFENVFERFHFTAAEPAGDDQARVVDPEMLGKVFEGLMLSGDRQRAGAFYTPRDLVRQMVDGALDAHVADRVANGTPPHAALDGVRILDPAVGTGAFLLEALAALRQRRRDAGLPVDYRATRRLIHEHLFGVDRDPTAVRLCELRIWLVMLAALRENPGELEPLPNLSHRIVSGDSLLDGIDLWRFRDGEELAPDAVEQLREAEALLSTMQLEFLEAHGENKATLRGRMNALETAMQQTLIEARMDALERRLIPLRTVEASTDLFGRAMVTRRQQQEISELERQQASLRGTLEGVASGRTAEAGFGYLTRFGSVARDGFDIVATNPPWVRSQHVEASTRRQLRRKYRTAAGSLWDGASRLGIRTPFGAQPDLAALFVERSMELLRPGGRMVALVPAKLFRGLHGCALRSLLEEYRVEGIEDLSESGRQLFDATVYPAVLRVQKAPPREHPVDVTIWGRDRRLVFQRDPRRLTPSGRSGEPWLLVPDYVDNILRQVRRGRRQLGEMDSVSIHRGIFTGANDVFIRPRGDFERELGPVVRPFVRPLLTGSGLDQVPTSEILWAYDAARPLPRLPAVLEAYFENHAVRLRARSDHDERQPLWQLFRVAPNAESAKVAWRDLSVLLDPVEVSAGSIALNTVYYASFENDRDAAGFARWMRSAPVRASAYALAERARGGWRRHFAWVVRMLPVPELPDGWALFEDAAFALSAADHAALDHWLGLSEEAA